MVRSFDIFTFYKTFNSFLNYHRWWLKSVNKIWRIISSSQTCIYWTLSRLHCNSIIKANLLFSCSTTSVTSWTWFNCFLLFIIRTIQASISCFLSSSTFLFVSFLSGSVSPCRALACCILTRWRFEVNCSLT